MTECLSQLSQGWSAPFSSPGLSGCVLLKKAFLSRFLSRPPATWAPHGLLMPSTALLKLGYHQGWVVLSGPIVPVLSYRARRGAWHTVSAQ